MYLYSEGEKLKFIKILKLMNKRIKHAYSLEEKVLQNKKMWILQKRGLNTPYYLI